MMAKQDGKTTTEFIGPIICPGHTRTVTSLEFSQTTEDGYFLLSSDIDSKAMLREGSSGDWIGTLLGHKGAVWCARINPDATRIVTASADFTAKLWSGVNGDELHCFTHHHLVKSCAFAKDSRYILTGGMEKKLRYFDLEKPESAAGIMIGHTSTILSIVESTDPSLIMSCGSGETDIKIWDKRTLKCVKSLETGEKLTSMNLSIDGSTVCSSSGKQVQLWDASSFASIQTFPLPYKVNSASFHAGTGRFVAGGVQDLCGYDYKTGKEITRSKGHHGAVRCLAFSPSGENYASGAEDGTIRIWEWPREIKE